MLYDPKWEATVQSDLFSIPPLVSWLEKQPRDGAYDFMDCEGGCLLGQYFTSSGLRNVRMGGTFLSHNGGFVDMPLQFRRVATSEPHTFGAALERARALL